MLEVHIYFFWNMGTRIRLLVEMSVHQLSGIHAWPCQLWNVCAAYDLATDVKSTTTRHATESVQKDENTIVEALHTSTRCSKQRAPTQSSLPFRV